MLKWLVKKIQDRAARQAEQRWQENEETRRIIGPGPINWGDYRGDSPADPPPDEQAPPDQPPVKPQD
jgi:hypothetical protein